MAQKKLPPENRKKIVCNFSDYEYAEFLASLKFENVQHISKLMRFFAESYMAMDADARSVVENYKNKNKIAGRLKKPH